MRGESRQELISDGTTLPGRRSSRYSRTSASNESSSSRSPVGALLFLASQVLGYCTSAVAVSLEAGTGELAFAKSSIARIELHFGYALSNAGLRASPACGCSRECLRIKIEQVEIVIRPLDDTPTTGSSKLDFGGRKGGARSAAVFCRASDHRHPRPARTEVSSQQSRPSQTPSDHLKIEGPMPFPLHGMAI
ncbi:hypothetical protein ACVW04_007240 [Bradyrhizobium sp. LM2.3]